MFAPLIVHTPAGARFALHHPAQGAQVRGLVVYLHPFAEEMNKSRRMAALQARALAREGFHVLQLDLQGCGDSEGELAQTRWAAWQDDVVQAVHWLRREHPADAHAPLWLWGLRAGALLAVEAARLRAAEMGPCNFLLWQAPTAGKPLVHQFLRLAMAGDLVRDALGAEPNAEPRNPPTPKTPLREQLQQGHTVEVAGYALPPALMLGLEAATLAPPPPGTGQLCWLEVSNREPLELLPASAPVRAAWAEAGWQVSAKAVACAAFWQTTEIEDAPALVVASTQALLNASSGYRAARATPTAPKTPPMAAAA